MKNALLVFFLFAISTPLLAQDVGDRFQLAQRAQGIPGHSEAFRRAVSHRYDSEEEVTVLESEDDGHWLRVVDDDGNVHWIIDDYIATQLAAPISPAPNNLCYNVAAWNIEHFHHGTSRGFPENTSGGPSFGDRTLDDIEQIATAIKVDLDFKILMLSEINGFEEDLQDGTIQSSEELNDLVEFLGGTWDYIIAESGRRQRVAIVWDNSFARLNASTEIVVPNNMRD